MSTAAHTPVHPVLERAARVLFAARHAHIGNAEEPVGYDQDGTLWTLDAAAASGRSVAHAADRGWMVCLSDAEAILAAVRGPAPDAENAVTAIAVERGRDYITPEDVSDALEGHDAERVRMAVLAVLGKQTDFGAEDGGLCAYIAWRGTPTDTE